MSFSGKVALVTGASRGLGRASALRLARDGAAVALNYCQSEAAAQAAVEEICAAGGIAWAVRGDVSRPEEVRSMVAAVEARFGAVDILVNNAGVSHAAELDEFNEDHMTDMRRVNVDAVIHATKAVVPGMKRRKFGRIINVASIAALGTRMWGTTFYAATKAAVIALTRRFAMDLGPHGITVNVIAPGFIPTDMAIAGRSPEEQFAFNERVAAVTMVGCVGKPEDIAHAVAFVADPRASFITAQLLVVDGGRMDYIAHP
jgi:NAD(P)-dependent dehydrogenase (short-subunit alcohol dehydrogenase family)